MNTQRTSVFLMANLGAEVSRIFSAKENKDEKRAKEGLERALKILREVMTISEMKTRASEINTLTDLISDIASPNPTLQVSRKNISSYFIPFATRMMSSTI